MDKNGIDASISLEFSLGLFKRYKSTGILQAKLPRFPGIHGLSIVYVQIAEGDIISCYIEGKKKQRYPVSEDMLIRFDRDKGPFEWSFRPSPAAPARLTPPAAATIRPYSQVNTGPLAYQIPTAVASKMVSSLPSERLLAWSIQQRRMFLLVWHEINGKKTIQEIKATLATSLSAAAVEETLHTLLTLKLIAIRS